MWSIFLCVQRLYFQRLASSFKLSNGQHLQHVKFSSIYTTTLLAIFLLHPHYCAYRVLLTSLNELHFETCLLDESSSSGNETIAAATLAVQEEYEHSNAPGEVVLFLVVRLFIVIIELAMIGCTTTTSRSIIHTAQSYSSKGLQLIYIFWLILFCSPLLLIHSLLHRFRMSCPLFLRIVNDVAAHDNYFVQKKKCCQCFGSITIAKYYRYTQNDNQWSRDRHSR